MKRAFVFSLAFLGALATAQANTTTYVFKDALRPHGHTRSQTAKLADGRACGTSANRDLPKNIPAFEKCMRARGWRLDHIATTRSPALQGRDTSPLQPGDTFIDPETGLSCHNEGGASICQSPRATVHYTDEWGLNCTRNNFVAICSNL